MLLYHVIHGDLAHMLDQPLVCLQVLWLITGKNLSLFVNFRFDSRVVRQPRPQVVYIVNVPFRNTEVVSVRPPLKVAYYHAVLVFLQNV